MNEKVKSIYIDNKEQNEEKLQSAISDSFKDRPADFLAPEVINNETGEKLDFQPYLKRSVEIQQSICGNIFNVISKNHVFYEESSPAFVKSSSHIFDNKNDAVAMAKAFLSSATKRVSKKSAEQVKEVARTKSSKQINFLDIL